jgi:hypothetical protein
MSMASVDTIMRQREIMEGSLTQVLSLCDMSRGDLVVVRDLNFPDRMAWGRVVEVNPRVGYVMVSGPGGVLSVHDVKTYSFHGVVGAKEREVLTNG